MRRKVYCITCGIERNPKCKPGQCQECRTKDKQTSKRQSEKEYLESIGYELVNDEPFINKHLSPVYTLIRKECGHEYTATYGNIRKQIITTGISPCSICGKETQKQKLIERNEQGCPEKSRIALAKYNAIQTKEALERYQTVEYKSFLEYAKSVRFLSEKTFYTFYYEINPHNLKRGKEYQLDHIVPIHYCFHNNISIEQCASKENLQMLSTFENRKKHHRLDEKSKVLINEWSQSFDKICSAK